MTRRALSSLLSALLALALVGDLALGQRGPARYARNFDALSRGSDGSPEIRTFGGGTWKADKGTFLQKAEGFGKSPDLTRPLDGGESVAFLAEVDPARAGEELVVVGDEGRLRQDNYANGAYRDTLLMGLLRADWAVPAVA